MFTAENAGNRQAVPIRLQAKRSEAKRTELSVWLVVSYDDSLCSSPDVEGFGVPSRVLLSAMHPDGEDLDFATITLLLTRLRPGGGESGQPMMVRQFEADCRHLSVLRIVRI